MLRSLLGLRAADLLVEFLDALLQHRDLAGEAGAADRELLRLGVEDRGDMRVAAPPHELGREDDLGRLVAFGEEPRLLRAVGIELLRQHRHGGPLLRVVEHDHRLPGFDPVAFAHPQLA